MCSAGIYIRSNTEENAHIEAYHGILKEVFQRVDYRTFGEIEQILKKVCNFL
jgi:putative transposase